MGSDRLIEMAEMAEGDAEIGVGFEEVRLDFDGATVGGDGLGEFFLFAKQIAELAVLEGGGERVVRSGH